MRCATRTGRGRIGSPAVWCMQLGKCEIRQGVGSKNLLSFVSVHFLYSWLLPAVQGSKEAKGGIVKEFYLVYIY